MNLYEMTFIVRPDLDEEGTAGVAELITERLQGAGGEIAAAYPWMPARRRLAFPIRDFNDGYYVTTVFRIDPGALREFENGLKLNENILRFLIVQATENNIKQAQQRLQAMAQAAAAPPRPEYAPAPQGGPMASPAGAPMGPDQGLAAAPAAPPPAAPAPTQAITPEATPVAAPAPDAVPVTAPETEVIETVAVEPVVVVETAAPVDQAPLEVEQAPVEEAATPAGTEE